MPETRVGSVPAWLWYAVGAVAYLSFGFTEMMGSDLWWHIAAGREVLQQGSPALVDTWSYTAQGQAWHNHEWLADLVFYGWVSVFGIASLVIWKWLLIVCTFALLQRGLARWSGVHGAALLASVAAAAIAAPFIDMRPQLYTLLGVAVLLNLCLDRSPRLWELLLLFLLWVNLHGGFIFGLMLLPLLVFPWLDLRGQTFRRALLLVGASAAVCLINPDGIGVFTLPLVYALDSSSPYRSIGEWRSPLVSGGIESPAYLYTLVLAAALAASWVLPRVRRVVDFHPAVLGMALLTAAMSMTSRRFIVLWALAFAALAVPFLALVLRQVFARHLLLPLAVVMLALGVWRMAPYSLRPAVAYHYLTAEYVYPEALVDVVELNGLAGNTFAYYNWGGYLHWRTDGALKVFIDGRANTVYGDQTYLDYVAVLRARPGWLERVENSGAMFFLWPHSRGGGRLIRGLLDTGRWVQLFEDQRGALLARRDQPLPPTLRRPRDSVAADLAMVYQNFRAGRYEAALSHASRAHDTRPWDFSACRWLKRSLQAVGRNADGDRVTEDCRWYFASRYLD